MLPRVRSHTYPSSAVLVVALLPPAFVSHCAVSDAIPIVCSVTPLAQVAMLPRRHDSRPHQRPDP